MTRRPTTKTPAVKILFVCTGNTCRSPMAEIIFKNLCRKKHHSGVVVQSAGTNVAVGADVMPEVIIALQNAGIPVPKRPHRAQQYLPSMRAQFDYVISLQNYEDPYGQGQAAYDQVCARLQKDLAALYQQIFNLQTAPYSLQ